MGSGRRGMTVLGKIPTAPKPINLPSQRLENRGLEPNVEIVPRGTFSWGSAGRSNAAGVNKLGTAGVTSSPPTSSGAWNGAAKIQAASASGNDAGSWVENARPSSAGSATRPSSAPTTTTNRAWGNVAKMQLEVQVQSSGFTVSPVEPLTLGSEESAEPLPQQNNAPPNRPTSADVTLEDKDRRPLAVHPGVSGYGRAGPGLGDGYSDYHPFVWQGISPARSHEIPVGSGMYPGPSHHDVYYSPFGVPHYSNMKDRDMLVVRMVGSPGFYGSYPPHVRHPEYIGGPGMYGSQPSQTGHLERFGMSGHGMVGASAHPPGMSMGFFPDGNEFLFHDGEGLSESGQDVRKHRDGRFGSGARDGGYHDLQRDGSNSRNLSSVSVYGTRQNPRVPKMLGRHKSTNGEGGDSGNELRDLTNPVFEGAVSSVMPIPERKITLLTKMSRGEVPSNEDSTNKTSFPHENSQGSEGRPSCEPKMENSTGKADNQNHENVSTVLEIKDANKVDGCVKIKQTLSEDKQDALSSLAISCNKDDLSKADTAVSEASSVPSLKTPRKAAFKSNTNYLSSTQELPASLSEKHNSVIEPKAQVNDHIMSHVDSHDCTTNKQSHKGSFPNGGIESVGGGHQAAGIENTKKTATEDVTFRDDNKAKTRAHNHKSEKEWRPKSPAVEAKLSANIPGPQVGKGGSSCEQASNTGSMRGELLSSSIIGCSTENLGVSEASSSTSSTQRVGKATVYGSTAALSSLLSSDAGSNEKVSVSLSEKSSSVVSPIVEVTVGPHTQCKNDRKGHKEVSPNSLSDTVAAAVQDNSAESFKVTATEGSSFRDDHKAKARQGNHKGEKEWRPKSPAVDATPATAKVSGSQASKANATPTSLSDIEAMSSYYKKIAEQESLQPFDMYDYEGQRAKLKEIAAQRAKQRRKEEEERTKEQKAKAFAKLEELNRRTLANPTNVEETEHGSVVLTDEGPDLKLKRKPNSSRHSPRDAPLHDSCIMEKQQFDEGMVWTPVRASATVNATSPLLSKNTAKGGEEVKELLNNEEMSSQTFRSKKDESARNTFKTVEKQQAAAISHQEQRQVSRREMLVLEEQVYSVHDVDTESSPRKKFGVEMKTSEGTKPGRLHAAQRQKMDSNESHVAIGIPINESEMKGSLYATEEHREHKQPDHPHTVPQSGNFHKGGQSSSAAFGSLQLSAVNSHQGQKQMNTGEVSLPEEHPTPVCSPEMNSGRQSTNTAWGLQQQSAASSHLGQKHMNRKETSLPVERVQSPEVKQPKGLVASSDAKCGPEKPGRSHVSWRQKNLSGNQFPSSDKPIGSGAKQMEGVSEESLDTPTPQFWKSHKVRNDGKQSTRAPGGMHQQGQIQVETRVMFALDEQTAPVPGPVIPELTKLIATSISNSEVEPKMAESVKAGRPHNSWRQKNTGGSYFSKQAFLKEVNEGHPIPRSETEELCEEHLDSLHHSNTPSASQTSDSHNVRNNGKHSSRAAFGLQPWHKNRPVKLANATLSQGQAQLSSEDGTTGQVVPVSQQQAKSSLTNKQGWDNRHPQETENSASAYQRKRGLQWQAESAQPSETNAQSHKQQQVYVTKMTEPVFNQHATVHNNRNKSNFTHVENHKNYRQYQPTSQAFKPREQQSEAKPEGGINHGDNRNARGRDKPSRRGRFNGCLSAAELDRRGAGAVIKTEISY